MNAERSRMIRHWPLDHPDEEKAGKPMEATDRKCPLCKGTYTQTAIDPARLAEMSDGFRDAFLKSCQTYSDGTICHPNRCHHCERRTVNRGRSA